MKLFLLMLFMAIALMATGQPPSGFSYQASLRNTDGTILSNRLVTIRITLTNQTSNTNFYSETHTSNTSALGIVSFNVGLGHDITGTFSEIPWGNEQVFIKIELQNNGGNYIEMGKTQLMSVPYAMFASDGNQGPQGEQGPPGEQGEQGEQGMPGNSGIDGRTILNGSDNPSTVDGADDDFYINTSTNTLFGPKTEGIWSSGVLLIGPQGNIGPAGADGEQGPSGIDGSAGCNGRTILHGNSNPTVQGADGDFYINTTTNMLFGPKMTGIWPAGISLIGLEGIQGIAGENGISVQWLGTYASSPGNPTLNQAYYNSTDRKSYIYNGTIWQIITQDGANAVNAVTGTGTSGKIAVWSDNTQLTSLESFNINPNVAVLSNPTALDDDPIFEVKNKAGQLVFGVYQSGVRIYVDDTQTKAAKGGFAIGGLSNSTKIETPLYFSVSPDSVRVLLREPSTKAAKGGFAIGGLSNSTKGVSQDLFFINSDSTRIYINADTNPKAAKGGFAIGGLSNSTKGTTEFMRITPDSSRIYIDTNPAKAGKGGFAIGGLSNSTKIPGEEYLRITRDSTRINVAENTTKAAKGGFAVGGLSTEKINPQNFMFLTPENYLIGHEAGKSLKTGTYNSFIGYMAGQSSIGGNKNIFIGQEAGKSNKNGNENIFIGYAAGTNGYEGNWNTFLGLETGYSNTGSNNTFIGYKAGKSHTTNGGNVYIGSKA
ncbi:MAG: collagen-like protein, partial [Salinivirgaceae bacterium]|nr:collagen-like protein [Salinivirgaceae bacterium]